MHSYCRINDQSCRYSKGNSIKLALILLYHFIAKNLDNLAKDQKAVLLAYIDMSKGFQKILHQNILIRLADWQTPTWILKVVTSYLTKRTMVENYKGATSNEHSLPGSLSQGDELAVILFLVAMSDVGLPPPLPLLPLLPGDISVCVPPLPPPVSDDEVRIKWIDDVSIGETIDLGLLVEGPDFIGPRNIHELHNLQLPSAESRVQTKLKEVEKYVQDNQMKLNKEKCKTQIFNFSRKKSFLPRILVEGTILEVVESFNILGVTLSSDLKWNKHIQNMVEKARKKMWFLRRLKKAGVSTENLVLMYKLFVRQALEYAAPLWAGALTKQNVAMIERIQFQCTNLIMGPNQLSYSQRLQTLDLDRLENRHSFLVKRFCTKMSKDERFDHLFPKRPYTGTRGGEKYLYAKRDACKPAIVKFLTVLNAA